MATFGVGPNPYDEPSDYRGHVFQAFVSLGGFETKCVQCGQKATTWDRATPCPTAVQVNETLAAVETGTIPVRAMGGVDPFSGDVDLPPHEHLALMVGAALGAAMAERDQAVAHLREMVALLAEMGGVTFASAARSVEQANQFLEGLGSPQTPAQTKDDQ